MARLAVSKDYFGAYSRLPRKAQRKADEFLTKFQRDSTSLSIHLEPIRGTVDPLMRSARIGDDYRVILRAPESGDVFLVLWADHHDEAYRWAANKETAVHPATGSLQIFDTSIAAREKIEAEKAPSAASDRAEEGRPSLFERFSDEQLFLAGVPKALTPSVRHVTSDADLDALLSHLPPEAGEVLTGLAAGLGLDEALEEVLGRETAPVGAPPAPAIDVTDVSAALARETTQRQFRLIEGEAELDAALRYPLDVWRVFLHPRQRKIAETRSKGPMRVLGGAGTGKTVVAMHRVKFLVREVFPKPDDRVLFTTFNTNLAEDLKRQLAKLLEPDELARVDVINIDAWASRHLKSRGKIVRPAFDEQQTDQFRQAFEIYGDDVHDLDFYRAEWREVVQEQGIRTVEEYVLAVRKHRGVPLSRTERRLLWPVFQSYRENLEREGLLELPDILRLAKADLDATGGPPRYQSVVVDETQDFSQDALRLVRAIAGPERPDDLFLVGDAHQRIYRRATSLSACGIQIRGRRSQTLRLNYRTTGSICRWSLAVLADVDVDDLDEGKADRRGYVSLREGGDPHVECLPTLLDEERAVVETVKAGLELGWHPEDVCIVARTRYPLLDRFEPALSRVGIASVLLDKAEPGPGVRLSTMHRVKGLEFPVVILVAMSEGDVPLVTPELRSNDTIIAAQALLRERSLVYVAASRARDELFVFGSGKLSPLIRPVVARPERRTPTLRPPKKSVPPPVPASAPSTATAPPRPAPPSLGALLAAPLTVLALPTRMENYADRMELETVGDLAQRAPSALLAEKNLGRGSIKDTRKALEAYLGITWESAAEMTSAPDVDAPIDLRNWDTLRATLTDEHRALPLDRLDVPTRVKTYARTQGITTLGELAEKSSRELRAADNMGRRTLADLPTAVLAYLEQQAASGAVEDALIDLGLFECWRALLEKLEPQPRMILTRRSGLAGDAETLKEIGETFGVSRERIRQLQATACEGLLRLPWAASAKRRIASALSTGAALLDDLAVDPWWAQAAAKPEVLKYLVEDVLESAFVIEFGERTWLSHHKAAAVENAWDELLAKAEHVPLPTPIATFEALVESIAAPIGPRLAMELMRKLTELLKRSETGDVVALGSGMTARLVALLRQAKEPMHIDEATKLMGGRFNPPDEVIRFGGGRIGLKEHIPDFDLWRKRLVPRAVAIIQENAPERQWSCTELRDELREEFDLPEWLGPFVLAALIKSGSELTYLGRLRVVLPGNREEEGRTHAHELILDLVRNAGEPMVVSAIMGATKARIGVSDFAVTQVLGRPQFVRVDLDRVGLVERDVPGGLGAIVEAADHVAALLDRRNRGLSSFHLHQEVAQLSEVHATWNQVMTYSVLHADPRFRFNQSGAIGLASWESTRVPTRLELARNALAESAGRVSVEAVISRIEAHYGERPEGDRSARALVGNLAMHLNANLAGDWLISKTT